jgi:hypothetical protein
MDQKKPAIFALMALRLALALAVSWIFWKGKLLFQKVGITKGVAVLPFENLSSDPDRRQLALHLNLSRLLQTPYISWLLRPNASGASGS